MDGKWHFSGFPAGKLKATAIPDLFFSELVPAIDDLGELKVTLHLFWLLQQQKRRVKAMALGELIKDTVLLKSLAAPDSQPAERVRLALTQAVARGTLLRVRVRGTENAEEWFFLNTESGRDLLRQVIDGELQLGGEPLTEEETLPDERTNIFILYEQNIGLLQPLIVEELEEAEKLYPMTWIEEAFKIAVENNVRRWRYIQAILERWLVEGKSDEEPGRDYREDGRSYLKGKYAGSVKH